MPHSEPIASGFDSSSRIVTRIMARSVAIERPSPTRLVLATAVPIFIASAFEWFVWPSSGRWSVFFPAVFVCAWFGGFASGVAATVISTAMLWWFFIPPEHALLKSSATEYVLALLFVLMGITVSGLLRGLRRAAVELSRKQHLLQGILDYSPDAIVIKDIEGHYILVNKAFSDLTGNGIATALEHTDLDLFSRPLAEELIAKDKLVRDTREPLVFEHALDRTRDRVVLVNEFPLMDDSEHVFAVGVIETDISQRKRDEDALRHTMDDLRVAQRVAHVGSWRWDFRTNQTTWSDELYQIFGIEPGQTPVPLINPGLKLLTTDSVLRLSHAIEHIRANGEPYELDLEFTRPDGARRWIAARGEPVRDADGQIVGINATAADITHIRELERLRDEWTSMIAHDLRQPIGVISMASEMIPESRAGGMAHEDDLLRRIQSAVRSLERMVNDLLDMSLLDAHRLKLQQRWVDPREMVRDAVQQLKHLTEGRVKICETGPLPSVFVDPMRMEQVLGNLLSNATKYGEPEGDIEVCLSRADGKLRITVTNRGPGIDANELPRLFERFVRSKGTRETRVTGLGLGLYISKGIVEAHGGCMSVESVPGKTTTFQIELPAKERRDGD